jgi:hypothetical protein
MSLKRSNKADLPPLILSDLLFPNCIPPQSVGAISVQAGLRPSLAADQVEVMVRKLRPKLAIYRSNYVYQPVVYPGDQ